MVLVELVPDTSELELFIKTYMYKYFLYSKSNIILIKFYDFCFYWLFLVDLLHTIKFLSYQLFLKYP